VRYFYNSPSEYVIAILWRELAGRSTERRRGWMDGWLVLAWRVICLRGGAAANEQQIRSTWPDYMIAMCHRAAGVTNRFLRVKISSQNRASSVTTDCCFYRAPYDRPAGAGTGVKGPRRGLKGHIGNESKYVSKNICTRHKKATVIMHRSPTKTKMSSKVSYNVQVRCLCHVMRETERP